MSGKFKKNNNNVNNDFALLAQESGSFSAEDFTVNPSHRTTKSFNSLPALPSAGKLGASFSAKSNNSSGGLSSIPVQYCSSCNQQISGTPLAAAVAASAPGPAAAADDDFVRLAGKVFHKHCLQCHDCGLEFSKATESATRAKFFLISGKIYCNLHAQLKTCAVCKEIIQEETAVSIAKLKQHYHKQCFVCANPKCKKSLAEEKKIVCRDGKVFCKLHAASGAADALCGVCKKSLVDSKEEDLVKSPVSKIVYHSSCLKCSFCKIQLGGERKPRFRNGRFFCQEDYDLLTPKCTTCGHEILARSVATKSGEMFHESCFKCTVCKSALVKYASFCGEPRCSTHKREFPQRNMSCFICEKAVKTSSAMSFAGELLHKKCFNCSTCSAKIKVSNGQIKAILGQDEAIHCWNCLRKAVGSSSSMNGRQSLSDDSAHKQDTVAKGLKRLVSILSVSEKKDDDIQSDAMRAIRPEPEIFDVSLIDSLTDEKEYKEEIPFSSTNLDSEIKASDEFEQFFHKHEVSMSYDKGEKIGEGSFGKVFVCRRRPDNMLMAMKQIILNEEDFGNNESMDYKRNPKIREMLKEAQILCKVKHPNVVKFLGIQIDRNKKTLNIFMEYIPGRSMYGHLYEFGAYSEQAVKRPASQVLQGLRYLHSMGIIHRDLKSKNILMSGRGVPKLADFGSAKMIDASGNQVQVGSAVEVSAQVCTPLYFPPELILQNVYTEKSDIWSFGCVMIEMITAKLPWSEKKFDNEWAAARYIAQDGVTPQIHADVSELCRDFINSCLNRDPKQRPSAEQLLAHPFLKDS